jgi:hypothetical protein
MSKSAATLKSPAFDTFGQRKRDAAIGHAGKSISVGQFGGLAGSVLAR